MLFHPATILSAAVTILTALVLFHAMVMVGRTRRAHGIWPPATTGHPQVERALRAQANSGEQMVIFLPLLWVATLYFHGWIPAALGFIWCIARFFYTLGYVREAGKRGPGFLVAMLATFALFILSVWGVVASWLAATAA